MKATVFLLGDIAGPSVEWGLVGEGGWVGWVGEKGGIGGDKVSSRLGSNKFCIARMRTVSHPAELAPLHNQ